MLPSRRLCCHLRSSQVSCSLLARLALLWEGVSKMFPAAVPIYAGRSSLKLANIP